MVLEHIFPENWIEKKVRYAFLLGFIYSFIGIFLARLLFGGSSGIASVIFTSLLLIPSLKKLFVHEERIEEKEKKFSIKRLYLDNKHLIHAYVGIFIGVYLAYYVVAFLSMYLGGDFVSLFREQLFLDPAISGRAAFDSGVFWSILQNNWWVLLSCFLLSLISGDGATFFVVWNASAWAAIFGIRAVAASIVLGSNPVTVALIMEAIALPHTLLEGSAYILAGIAGAVISSDVISKAGNLKKFLSNFVLFGIGIFVIDLIFKNIFFGTVLLVLRIIVFMTFIYFVSKSFNDKKHVEVFVYNYWLFLVAFGLFVLGVLVETFVLSNSGILNNYYAAASSFFLHL